MPVATRRVLPKTPRKAPPPYETKPVDHVDFNRITDEQFDIALDHLDLENEIQMLLRTPYR